MTLDINFVPTLMRSILHILFGVAFSAFVFGAPEEPVVLRHGGVIAADWKLTLRSDKADYSTADRINLTLLLENVSKKESNVCLYSTSTFPYWAVLTDERGVEVGTRRLVSNSAGSLTFHARTKKFQPGQKNEERMELSEFVALPGPGHYRLTVWRFHNVNYRLAQEDGLRSRKSMSLEGIESNRIGFTVHDP